MKCLALVLLSGCSFFMVKGPSDTGNPPRAYPSCTASMTYPIVDTVLAGLFLASMTGAIADDGSMDSTINDKDTRAERITTTAIFTGLFAFSAYVGYSRVSRCRNAEEDFHRAYPNGMPYGYPYYPQPYPQQYPPAYPGTAATPPPYPGTTPPPYPGTATPPPRPTASPAPTPPPTATPPPANALGTEGDVCAADAECGAGLACQKNVCVRPPPRAK